MGNAALRRPLAGAFLMLFLPCALPAHANSWKTFHPSAGLRFRAPANAEVTVQGNVPKSAQVVALTVGSVVLLFTVYHGDRAPKPRAAKKIHAEEIRREVKTDDSVVVADYKTDFLGKERQAVTIPYRLQERLHVARLVAARAKGRTVVAAWSNVGLDNQAFVAQVLRSVSLL